MTPTGAPIDIRCRAVFTMSAPLGTAVKDAYAFPSNSHSTHSPSETEG